MAGGLLMILSCHADDRSASDVVVAAQFARPSYELRLGSTRIRFDPALDRDLVQLRAQVAAALDTGNAVAQSSKTQNKKHRRGLKEIERLTEAVLNSADLQARNEHILSLLETVAAVNNDQRPPLPKRIDGLEALFALFTRLHVPVGEGRNPAFNLHSPIAAPTSNLTSRTGQDLSRVDPLPSTFWRRPPDIPAADLYHGFGRSQPLGLEAEICSYAAPKETYGLNPGFLVTCQGQKVKLKFAEISSEPFATRIFFALGYHIDPTDFAWHVKVRYDRRILLEFNSRRKMEIHFTALFFLPLYTLELQKRYQPFDYITAAVLRDGGTWSGTELRTHLFHDPLRLHPEEDPSNYRPEIEAQIDYLVTGPANVQPAQPAVNSIGPWDFGQLDHADRRELRGAGLLAAWLGWFDTRFQNTRLRLVRHNSNRELAHYFSDLGGVLGQTSGLLFSRGELPNAFPWAFTHPALYQGPHHLARPLRLYGYRPIASTPAFAAMTIDDARWMARLIAQLTEQQLVQALIASGYDSAEVRLYTEKLLSRRDHMIMDLGLASEIPLLRPAGVNQAFSYNPVADGLVTVLVPGEGLKKASFSNLKVINGKLISSH